MLSLTTAAPRRTRRTKSAGGTKKEVVSARKSAMIPRGKGKRVDRLQIKYIVKSIKAKLSFYNSLLNITSHMYT